MTKFNWEESGPSEAALQAFNYAVEADFPDTYSGQSWKACFRLWNKFKNRQSDFMTKDINDDEVYESMKGMGLSGFMGGWAFNALRQMWNMQPKPNPALATMDDQGNIEPSVEPYPSIGPAEKAMRLALGGEE